MKSLKILWLVLITGLFASCDLVDQIDDVNFKITLPVSLSVNVPTSSSSGISFSNAINLSIDNDSNIIKYAKKIKELKVEKVTYTISDADPASVNFTDVRIVNSQGNLIASANFISLGNTSETAMTLSSAATDFASSFLDDYKEQITLSGNLSSTPVKFHIDLKIHLVVTADALQ